MSDPWFSVPCCGASGGHLKRRGVPTHLRSGTLADSVMGTWVTGVISTVDASLAEATWKNPLREIA